MVYIELDQNLIITHLDLIFFFMTANGSVGGSCLWMWSKISLF